MIVERAIFKIKPGEEQQFQDAVAQAREFPAASRGFRSLRLLRGIESPDTFLLLIEWDSVADHVEGFRDSPAFAKWRELIAPHFETPPDMEHYSQVV